MPRDQVTLECTDCRSRNYHTTKNRRTHPERMETRKFCPRCGKHKPHKETK
ncbi:MAG: 50S ribosomal protein L33 [Gemmatimonadales bacterium]